MDAWLAHALSWLIPLIEAVGVAVMLAGFLIATGVWLAGLGRVESHAAYLAYRRRSVRGLILGLEFLVAADIIRTITIDYSVHSLLMLGLIVLIRTFLVFALHLEIEGRLPWQPPSESDPAPEPEPAPGASDHRTPP